MKKFYISPAIEVTEFVADDILTQSTMSFDDKPESVYDVINQGITVNVDQQQSVTGGGKQPFSLYK